MSLSTMLILKWKFIYPHTFVRRWHFQRVTSYPVKNFDTNKSVPSLEPKAHDIIVWVNSGGQHEGEFFTLRFFFKSNIHLWETRHILIQNLKKLGVWVLLLKNAQVSTFLTNVRLPTLLTLIILSTVTILTHVNHERNNWINQKI